MEFAPARSIFLTTDAVDVVSLFAPSFRRRRTMIGLSKLAFAAAVAAIAVATPALAQSFDPDAGTGNVLSFSFAPIAAAHDRVAVREGGHRAVAARRSGVDAFAMVAQPSIRGANSSDPALTGGGSLGYNQMLLQY
jgi:hypothetical protein